MVPFYKEAKKQPDGIVQNVEFSITKASSEEAKKNFIIGLKNVVEYLSDPHYSQENNPNFTFVKVTADKNGRIFAILCHRDMDLEHEHEEMQNSICFKMEAVTINKSAEVLPKIAQLTGGIPDFIDDAKNHYLPTQPLNNPQLQNSHLSTIQVNDMTYQNLGIGREMIVFWKNFVMQHSSSQSMDLLAVNGMKNINYYKTFSFQTTTPICSDHENRSFAYMANDNLKNYFESEAYKKTAKLHDSFCEETKAYIKKAQREIDKTLKKLQADYNKKPKVKKP